MSVQDHFTLLDSDILDVTELQAEDHSTEESSDPIHNHSEVSHGYKDLPSGIQDTTTTAHQDAIQYNADADEIPELEDWDNGQFDYTESTLITYHNTHSESERIRREYTQNFLDLTDNQYYEEETSAYQLQYSSLDPNYYNSPPKRSQKPPIDPNGYYPPPPDPADVQHWYVQGRGKRALLHEHRLYGEKARSAESRKASKRQQNYRQQMRK